jgi:hypothetical protein
MLRLFGKYWAKQVLGKQRHLHQQQQQLMLAMGNGMKFFFSDPEKLKESSIYKRCAAIISLLSPMDIKDMTYIRLGKNNDGGYVMADYFQMMKFDAAYSFGIDNDVSWDEDIASRGIDVFMYDHTIKSLPKKNPRFHYFKLGVTGFNTGDRLRTFKDLISQNQHTHCKNMILKMDIEGCEWDVFKETDSHVINQFSQIVVEFHGLRPDNDIAKLDVLKKINETHQSVHIHANSSIPQWVGDLVLPESIEVTYVRKSDFPGRFTANTRQFPTEIDQPNSPDFPEIYLGNFSVDER